jgi:aerobic carbon-monoxide dehydrogenase small subunit
MSSRIVNLTVNGAPKELIARPGTTLLLALREALGLTGAKRGCAQGACGTCTVLLDGTPVVSCLIPVATVDGAAVTTIEGIGGADGGLDAVQAAFCDGFATQCGFCTPGMIMSAIDIVRRNGYDLDDDTIRKQLDGNICRCTGYHNIVLAIQAGAAAMRPR